MNLQQLLIKPITTRVAGRSPAKGFILLFVVGLKANCCIKMNKLLEIYNLSLDHPDVSGAEQLELLMIRDKIANVEAEINPVEQKILSDADKKLIANAKLIYQEISRFINLADYRQKHHISSKQWWWYLDVFANLSHYLELSVA